MKIDLLPQEYRPQPSFNLMKVSLVILLILTVFVSGWFLASDLVQYNAVRVDTLIVQDELDVLQQTFESKQNIQQVSDEIDKKKKEIAILTGPHLQMGEILGEMSGILPNHFWFESLSVSKENIVTLRGGTNRMSAVANYTDAIENSPLFQTASVKSISTSTDVNDYYRFEMNVVLEKAGNANE